MFDSLIYKEERARELMKSRSLAVRPNVEPIVMGVTRNTDKRFPSTKLHRVRKKS